MPRFVILQADTVRLLDDILSHIADAKDVDGNVVLENLAEISSNCSKLRALIMMEREMYTAG